MKDCQSSGYPLFIVPWHSGWNETLFHKHSEGKTARELPFRSVWERWGPKVDSRADPGRSQLSYPSSCHQTCSKINTLSFSNILTGREASHAPSRGFLKIWAFAHITNGGWQSGIEETRDGLGPIYDRSLSQRIQWTFYYLLLYWMAAEDSRVVHRDWCCIE